MTPEPNDPLHTPVRALARAVHMFGVLDREHTTEELYRFLRGIRLEVDAAWKDLAEFGSSITAPSDGLARRDHPETSKGAARSIATRAGSMRHHILSQLKRAGGMTDHEIQVALKISGNSQRPRRVELKAAGWVQPQCLLDKDNGTPEVVRRRNPDTGQLCEVWEVTAAGRVALARLAAGQLVLMNRVMEPVDNA